MDDGQRSDGYDGPGPCGVSSPHRTTLGRRHWCLPSSPGARANGYSTETTAAKDPRTDSSNSSGGGSGGAASDWSSEAGPSKPIRLSLTVTLPECQSAVDGRRPPYPVVVFINGFQLRASVYAQYAKRLASWGYAVVQYDTGLFRIIDDRTELRYLGCVLAWLAEENARSGGFAHGSLDLSSVGVVGHSRGAKLAALHLVGDRRVKAAYLVDPVDNTSQTPESPAYPSAVRALRAAGLPVGITGASIASSCNPTDANHLLFWQAAGGGSWHQVVADSGHAQFCDAGPILNRVFAALCRAGPLPNRAVISLALPPMTAWFDQHLRAGKQPSALVQHFSQWAAHQQECGRMQFEIKAKNADNTRVGNGKFMNVPIADELAEMLLKREHAPHRQ